MWLCNFPDVRDISLFDACQIHKSRNLLLETWIFPDTLQTSCNAFHMASPKKNLLSRNSQSKGSDVLADGARGQLIKRNTLDVTWLVASSLDDTFRMSGWTKLESASWKPIWKTLTVADNKTQVYWGKNEMNNTPHRIFCISFPIDRPLCDWIFYVIIIVYTVL